jgi:hypothetical protein
VLSSSELAMIRSGDSDDEKERSVAPARWLLKTDMTDY